MLSDQHAIAIMQPYIFPYIGYFHLIQASNLIVFYDDVTYIKQGWVNRNRILNYDKPLYFTVPISKASSFKLINEISPALNDHWKNKFYKQLTQNYSKAPFFKNVVEPIMSVFSKEYKNVTDMAIESISTIYSYLGIEYEYTKSSICSGSTRSMEKAERLIEIVKQHGYKNYINVPGGKELYSKKYFLDYGVHLFFIKSDSIVYKQYLDNFVPWLSIIDIIMFNDIEYTLKLFDAYTLD